MKAFAAAVALSAAAMVQAGCYPKDQIPEPMSWEEKLAMAHNHAPIEKPYHRHRLPRAFDWGKLGPDGSVSMLSGSWNQHIPVYCGSCWLHGSLSAVNDRIKIMNRGKGPDVMLARQTLLQCGPLANLSNGCHGGAPSDVFSYMQQFGLPDETCMLYKADDSAFMHLKKEGKQCPPEGICVNCMHGHTPECWAMEKPLLFTVKSFGPIEPGEEAMKAEIFHRGPIVCSMASTDHFDYQYHGGVYVDPNNSTEVNHDVEVVGWGEDEDGTPFWRVRNSWGTYWGEDGGFFRIRRGTNELQIENDCWYAIPDNTMQRELEAGKLVGDMVKGLIPNPKWVEMEKKIKEQEEKMRQEEEKIKKEIQQRMEEREKALKKIKEEMEKIREEQEEEYRERIKERIERLREEAERRKHRYEHMFGEEDDEPTPGSRLHDFEDESAHRLSSL